MEALTEADTGEEGTYRFDRTNGLVYIYAGIKASGKCDGNIADE